MVAIWWLNEFFLVWEEPTHVIDERKTYGIAIYECGG